MKKKKGPDPQEAVMTTLCGAGIPLESLWISEPGLQPDQPPQLEDLALLPRAVWNPKGNVKE